jgi:hypothetical protein
MLPTAASTTARTHSDRFTPDSRKSQDNKCERTLSKKDKWAVPATGTTHTGWVSEDWEAGERHPIRWGRIAVVLAIVALAMVWWSQRDRGLPVERDLPPVAGPSDAPEVVVRAPQETGNRWYCPDDSPVRAYEDGLYVPPHYAHSPRDVVRPDRCFATPELAEAEGYTLAPPPPDTVVAGGVYVIPALLPGRQVCADLADEWGAPVPCPTRLPTPGTGAWCANDACRFDGGVVIEQRFFNAPDDFCDGCQPEVILTAVKLEGRSGGPTYLVTCPRHSMPEDLASVTQTPEDPSLTTLQRLPRIQRCGQGPPWLPGIGGLPHEGHTAARWRDGDIVYAVSVGGHGAAQEAVLREILKGVELCTRNDDGLPVCS